MRHLVVAICLLAGCEPTIGDDPLAPSDEDDPTYMSELDWQPDPELDSDAPACAAGDDGCDTLDEIDVEDTPLEIPDGVAAAVGSRAWPNGIIPYVIDGSVNRGTRIALARAMTNWTTQTENRIRFRAKRKSDKAYVRIVRGAPLVRPFVGYRAGQVQTMQLRDNEYVTVIKHEIGHVVGFQHEHKRTDRGHYIDVKPGNVVGTSLCESQFSRADADRGVPYDRVSIMHYRTSELRRCRRGPVLTRLDGQPINHVWKLSRKDLDAVAKRYDSRTSCRRETDSQMCTRLRKECGTVTAKDNCGTSRTVDCGDTCEAELTAWAETLEENGSMSTTGACMTVADALTADDAPVTNETCRAGDEQDWRTTRGRQLAVKHSLGCATVAVASIVGAPIVQRACNADDPAQRWLFKDMEIVNGRTGECLRVPSAHYVSGQEIVVAACTGGAGQRFNYRPDTEEIKAGGLCLTAKGGAEPGAAVVLRDCDGRKRQRWFQGRGGFVSRDDTSQCMRVAGGAVSGTRIEVSDCNDATGQRWALRGAVRDMRGELCLQRGDTDRMPLTLGDCTGSDHQMWTFWSR